MKWLVILLLSLFVASSTVLFDYSSANAWSGNLPSCEMNDYPSNWNEKIKEFKPLWGTGNQSTVIIGWGQPNQVQVFATYNTEITFNEVNGNKSLTIPSDNDGFGVDIIKVDPATAPPPYVPDGATSYVQQDGFFNTTGGNTGTFEPACISYASNVTYSPEWTGTIIPGTLPEDENESENPGCEAWNVVCWIGDFTGKIVDGFQDLWDNFAELFTNFSMWLADIFVGNEEDQGLFQQAFTSINDAIHQKLGFLTFPFDFVASVFGAILLHDPHGDCGEANTVMDGCTLIIPKILGDSHIQIDFGVLDQRFPQLWDTLMVFVRIVIIFGLVELLYLKYMSIIRSGE